MSTKKTNTQKTMASRKSRSAATTHTILTLPKLKRGGQHHGQHHVWDNLRGVARAVAVAETALATSRPALYLADTASEAYHALNELKFAADGRIAVHDFPEWEILAYDPLSPGAEIRTARIAMLAELPSFNGICVVSIPNLMQRLAPPEFIHSQTFSLRVGQKMNLQQFASELQERGYERSSWVTSRGEYAVRGSLIDFYPPGERLPVRIDLFDDKIEALRLFDPETQNSQSMSAPSEQSPNVDTDTTQCDSIHILPTREVPSDEKSIADFRRNFRATFDGSPEDSPIYHDVSHGRIPQGIEFYAPLFFKKMAMLFDYLPDDTLVFHSDAWLDKVKQNTKHIQSRFEVLQESRHLLPPDTLYADAGEIEQTLEKFTTIGLHSLNSKLSTHHAKTRVVRGVSINRSASDPTSNLKKFIKDSKARVLFTTVSAGYLDLLVEMLTSHGLKPEIVSGWSEFISSDARLCVSVGELTGGALFHESRAHTVAVISDNEVFGYSPRIRRARRIQTPDADAVIGDIDTLEKDCLVVHEKHGIGRYRGLSTLEISGIPTDLMIIEYANNDKLYVPVSAVSLVSKYIGNESEKVTLHTLGGAKWDKARSKASKQAYDIAAQLLDTHARRDMTQGISYDKNTDDYRLFCEQFAHNETPDQTTSIREIETDMETKKPMDRIVCGDVGFGKTELAMRAAFLAIHGGRQVALLAPTTLLAHQHTQSARTRFADWPVRIEMLSRFNSRAEQIRILEGLKNGTVDFVVGTHKLLQKNVEFKDPGLFIVDEEQQFGVRHKEKLKSMCVGMDLLTLTATPIPRTLSITLHGMRDISIIATPPPNRKPVKTLVTQWDSGLLSEACRRELHRGGQIYFLHNRVDDIDECRKEVQALIPEATLGVAHGQMSERELETTMQDFYRHRFDILICTTIIESGLDIPSVNTIIINNAERLGLAQLHQLRGRVGRSDRQAYAYLVANRPLSALPSQAVRRLDTLDSLSGLGVGFSLASHDLEIRGAGELLGFKQSGSACEVGFRMYHDMVKTAIDALRSGKMPNPERPINLGTEVNIGAPSLITEDYVPDVNLRLLLYRRLAVIDKLEALDDMHAEMIDRFGPMPEYTVNLFRNTALKIRGHGLGIVRMDIGAESGHFHFLNTPQKDIKQLMKLASDSASRHLVEGKSKLTFRCAMETIEQRYSALHRLFDELDTKHISTGDSQ